MNTFSRRLKPDSGHSIVCISSYQSRHRQNQISNCFSSRTNGRHRLLYWYCYWYYLMYVFWKLLPGSILQEIRVYETSVQQLILPAVRTWNLTNLHILIKYTIIYRDGMTPHEKPKWLQVFVWKSVIHYSIVWFPRTTNWPLDNRTILSYSKNRIAEELQTAVA